MRILTLFIIVFINQAAGIAIGKLDTLPSSIEMLTFKE